VNGVRPVDYYNAIYIKASAESGNSVTITDLKFIISGASACGGLQSMNADTPEQWVVATDSLTSTSWVLGGKVTVTSASPSSATKMEIFTYALPEQTLTDCIDPAGRSGNCWDQGVWMMGHGAYVRN
jgi:hypothetical protein